jgi:hypothetical protein
MYSLYKNEYRIFKLVETSITKGLKEKEENTGNASNQAIKQNIHRSATRKFIFFLSFAKSENRRVE